MLSESQLLSDVDFMIGDLPNRDGAQPTATIGLNAYDVAVDTLDRDKVLLPEGMDDQYRFSIYANAKNVDDAGDRPEVNELVTFGGDSYTVLQTSDDPIKQVLRLDLGEEFARGGF